MTIKIGTVYIHTVLGYQDAQGAIVITEDTGLATMTTGGLDEVIADHRNLLNAIERCDLAAFEPLVERHLYGGIRRLGSKLTKEYADFFEPENVK